VVGEETWTESTGQGERQRVSENSMTKVRSEAQVGWVAPAIVVTLLLVVYGLTTCRSVFWYDSAEFATAAKVWGIPHPPGYPGYIAIAHLFTYLPLSPAHAVNVLSSVSMAGAMGLLVVLCQQFGVRPLYAALSTLLVASADVYWLNAVVAEVYGPGLCFTLGVLTSLINALQTHRMGPVWFASWLAGFGLGVHYFLATLGLGYVVLLFAIARRQRARFGDYAVATAMFAFGLSVFVLLPLRSAQGAPLNFGDPQHWPGFVWVVSGGNYRYFFTNITWERAKWFGSLIAATLTWPGLVVAFAGVATLGKAVLRVECLALLLAIVGNTACFLPYNVHDAEVFLIPTLVLLTPFIGLGAEWIHRRLGTLEVGRVPLRFLVAGLLSAVGTYRVVANYSKHDFSKFSAADEYARSMVDGLPHGAFIANFTTPPEWRYDAVFTYYRIVQSARPDVTMVILPPPEYLVQLVTAKLPVYVYVPTYPVQVSPFRVTEQNGLFRLELDGSQAGNPPPAPVPTSPSEPAEPPASAEPTAPAEQAATSTATDVPSTSAPSSSETATPP
jgi:hypothetical protein